MTDRELTALMAAMIYAGQDAMNEQHCVKAANRILIEIDARIEDQRDPVLPECPPEPK